MTKTSGVAEEILSLPKGGGSIAGLGEKFQPDLHTGTGSYPIPLDIPNGPNDIAPKLTLLYHTGAGNGPFGMGFSLNLFTVSRSTDKQIPSFTDDDPLVLIGGGDLIRTEDGKYHLKVDTGSWRIEREMEGFRLVDRDGKYYRLGLTDEARLFAMESENKKILSWLLEEIEDPLKNRVTFTYIHDSNQIYLKQIDYSIYSIRFEYEDRPDPVIDGRAGFLITTSLRCKKIELLVNNQQEPLVRRWQLEYIQSDPGGHSLLHKVSLIGFAETGSETAILPVLTLDYTKFLPRNLERFTAQTPDAVPGSFVGGRRELIDWNGNGLPDLIEISKGRARIWNNLGHCTWGRPISLGYLPAPISLDESGVSFADMNGDGTSDLIMLNRPLSGYYPHFPGGGFDRPVFWSQTPNVLLSKSNARLVDLNGDRITDLLVAEERYFNLYYRDPENGWRQRPYSIPRPLAPPVSFADPRIHLADMNGDGFEDIVMVGGNGVTYWPYLGNGRWAEPIDMKNPPNLTSRFDPKRMHLSDIDGDGCADLIYIDSEEVVYWINRGGIEMGISQKIRYTPIALPEQVRLADMKGTGTAGILWSYSGTASHNTDYFYLDFTGGIKPYLLCRIDNGMGLVTDIEYGTSVEEAMRDKSNGAPWKTFLPFSIPVVTAIRTTDKVTDGQSLSKYRYHDGHFDGIGREFAGFGMVESEELGDDSVTTMLTRNWHHLGIDPANPHFSSSSPERARLRALRGRLLHTETYGLDGSSKQDKPYFRTENVWNYKVKEKIGDIEILFPFLMETRTIHFEREPVPYRVVITRNLLYDDHGNVREQEQHAEDPRDSVIRILHSTITFVNDPSGRFVNKPVRVTQKDENEKIIATTISYYDGLNDEGSIGSVGLLTRQESLVLTDEIISRTYGDNPPDFGKMGYHKHVGESGWWVNQLTYERNEDTTGGYGLKGTVTNARGNTTQIFFDEFKIHPVKIVDALGNAAEAMYDYRANKLNSLTDANASTISNRYDPLGRLVKTIEPGASDILPTTSYIYDTGVFPASLIMEQRAVNGEPEVVKRRTYLDGTGQVLEERIVTKEREIVERSQLYSTRGLVKAQFLPYDIVADNNNININKKNYSVPSLDLPHRRFRYDALGRLVEVINPDGSIQKQHFESGTALLYDEEDNRTDSAALHRSTPTRQLYDSTGRIVRVTLDDGGRSISTSYEYDIKGNLVKVMDANGKESTFSYDLLGRRLVTKNPNSGTTLFVFDANGNQIERRDVRREIVLCDFDELDRLKTVSFPTSGIVSAQYIYNDSARPATLEEEAATNNSKGRVVKVTHQGGEELYDYDPLGRVIRKKIRPSGLPDKQFVFDFTYRADGQRDTIRYPSHSGNSDNGEDEEKGLQVKYEYNQRGLVHRISNFITQIDYNLFGQRISVAYTNNVRTLYRYDPLTLRLKDLITRNGSNTVLQEFHYDYDKVGNLLSVSSPDPKWTADYVYDDLYRLEQATMKTGESWSYRYDDSGNIIFKSDIGDYQYDTNGLLTSAGTDTFAYTSAGQLSKSKGGDFSYDSIGRLESITNGNEHITYLYDHNGRRTKMQIVTMPAPDDDGSSPSSNNIFTPDDMISIENGVVYMYVFDGSVRISQIRLDTKGRSYLHGDHLGSTTLVTGQAGEVLQKIRYDPFGAILENTPISAGMNATRFLYTGQTWDDKPGLYYLNTRYYDPKLGRFITPDTLVPELYHPQAWNRYSYVQNNPLRFIDPTGHFWEEIGDWFENNWKYIVAAVAIVVVVALTILTAGALAAALGIAAGWVYAGVAAGMVIGGVVGGISAYQSGGDVLLGVLTGAAVGGAASLAGMGIGAGMSALFGAKTLLGTVLTGALSGAVNGAAMGFTAGFAGGQGSAGEIWGKIWQGALVGAISGAVFGFGSYALNKGWFGTGKLDIAFPKGAEAIKKVAIGFAAGSAAELGRQAASGGELDWTKILLAGVGGAGIGSFVKFGGNSGIPVLDFLKPEYVGVVSSIFAQANSAVFVLDYADDLWNLLKEKEAKTPEIKGKF